MKQKALDILDRLKRSGASKEDRLTDLMRDPFSDATPGWFMHVPKCFNDALDIKQTTRVIGKQSASIWTQGATFTFKTGDLLYDTSKAYELWSLALQHIRVAVQVRSAIDATSPQPGIPRKPGSVTFDVLEPTEDRTKLVPKGSCTLTQDEFVRMLITGNGLPLQKP